MLNIKKHHPDYILFGIVVILIILGVLILAGISAPLSQQKFGNPYHYLLHQILFGITLGTIGAILAFKIPLSYIKKWSPSLLLINLILLGLVFLPIIGINFI